MSDAAVAAPEDVGFAGLAPLGGAAIAALALSLAFFDTVASMVEVWERSETFTHGFFVLPIFLWLVWRERAAIAPQTATLAPGMLVPIAAAGALWLVSRVADVLAGQQIAFVLMLVFVIVAFAGRAIARTIRFPLLFLLFLAPLGEELVPLLMDITAELTVGAVALTGIPIYREGLFFSLPSGDWSVVEACSGIRYLIASIVLGALYAHLYMEGTSRKLAFLALSAIVPIVANGVRAFLIVMIGHFSSMQLATGVDHLVYGWLFFGIVMFLLFSVGALFRRGEPVSSDAAGASRAVLPGDEDSGRRSGGGRGPVTQTALIVVGVAVWPLWAGVVDAREDGVTLSDAALARVLPLPEASSDEIDARVTAWRPTIAGHDAVRQAVVPGEAGRPPVLALAYAYAAQRQGKEMIASGNVLVPSRDPHWRRIASGSAPAPAAADDRAPMTLERSRLESAGSSLLVWRWYRVGDTGTGDALRAKLLETRDRLMLRAAPSVSYVLATDASDPAAASRALADAFAHVVRPNGTPPRLAAGPSGTGRLTSER